MALIELSLLTFFIIAVIIIAVLLKKLMVLVVNSVIGFFALFTASLFLPSLQIWPWATLITAIGGIVGFAAVLLLHLLGIAF